MKQSASGMPKPLQIVAFDVPYPPNYGGAIDVFYRIKALSSLGVPIHLHAFTYRDRRSAPELRSFCQEVHYYPRPFRLRHLWHALPFIVVSRMAEGLLPRLAAAPHPILFEGLHACGFIEDARLKDHLKMVRMHNVETHYYRNLAGLQGNLFRRWHFRQEARKIQRFESRVLQHAQYILPISTRDEPYFRSKGADTSLLPAFHGQEEVSSLPGSGEYVLFHGNLSVADNERSAEYLMRKALPGPLPPLVIAGRNPSRRLRGLCARQAHVMLAENPTQDEMADLIRNAHINLLYTLQADGVKIKLLRALFQGRHLVVNPRMVEGTGLESLCHLAEDATEIRKQVERLMTRPFEAGEVNHRKRLLGDSYSDRVNARKLTQLMDRHRSSP